MFDGVSFDECLLTANDKTGTVHKELPFEKTIENMKLNQDKLKARIYAVLNRYFDD